MGWVTGFEPATSGATVRRSTAELYPPCGIEQTVSLARRAVRPALGGVAAIAIGKINQAAVADFGTDEGDVLGARVLRVVHQLVGVLNKIRGQPGCDDPPLCDCAEPQAHDANVNPNRMVREALVIARPVVVFDGAPEALADRMRLRTIGNIRDEKAKFIAAKARVQILG